MPLTQAGVRRTRDVGACLAAAGIAVLAAIAPARAAPIRASFYGAESGRLTASGRPFRPEGFSAAHPAWRFGTCFRACFRACHDGIVDDRGPAAWTHRGIDLSHGLARAIGLEPVGVATIDVAVIACGGPAPRADRRRRRAHRSIHGRARHHRHRF